MTAHACAAAEIAGPAIIQQLDAPRLVPGDTLRVDDARNLLIEVAP